MLLRAFTLGHKCYNQIETYALHHFMIKSNKLR